MENNHSGHKAPDHENSNERHHRSEAHVAAASGVIMLVVVDFAHCSEFVWPAGDGHDARNDPDDPGQNKEIWVHLAGGGETACRTGRRDGHKAMVGLLDYDGPPLQADRTESEHHLDVQMAHVKLGHENRRMTALERNYGCTLALGTRAAKTFYPGEACHRVQCIPRLNQRSRGTRVKEVGVNGEEAALDPVYNDVLARDAA